MTILSREELLKLSFISSRQREEAITMAEHEHALLVTVDRSKCCGYTLCAVEAPDVYSIDDQGFAVGPETVPAELEDQARAGAAACPETAIMLARRVPSRQVSPEAG
jgi:ferredoxin